MFESTYFLLSNAVEKSFVSYNRFETINTFEKIHNIFRVLRVSTDYYIFDVFEIKKNNNNNNNDDFYQFN